MCAVRCLLVHAMLCLLVCVVRFMFSFCWGGGGGGGGRCALFVVGWLLFVVRVVFALGAVRCSLFVLAFWLLGVRCSLSVVCCYLFVVC